MIKTLRWLMAALLALLFSLSALAEQGHKPFILAELADGELAEVQQRVEANLTGAGFEIVGRYVPYDDALIVIVTNDGLKNHAAKSDFGGYGAAQRVSLTRVDGKVQVAYTNPTYMAFAYRMEGDLADVTRQLGQALGNQQQFGADNERTERQLRRYRYMFGMENFGHTSAHQLNRFPSYEAALKTVEENLAQGVAGIRQVYRIDIPGKDEVLFGVSMQAPERGDRNMDDAKIMGDIDFKDLRSTAHLPYEILVSGREVYHLYARFRIAISFPDLSMIGSNSFMSIMDSPDAIKTALSQVAGAAPKKEFWQ